MGRQHRDPVRQAYLFLLVAYLLVTSLAYSEGTPALLRCSFNGALDVYARAEPSSPIIARVKCRMRRRLRCLCETMASLLLAEVGWRASTMRWSRETHDRRLIFSGDKDVTTASLVFLT
jgi:hypothetical protein